MQGLQEESYVGWTESLYEVWEAFGRRKWGVVL